MTETLLALDLSLSSTGYAVIQWNKKKQKATVLEVGHIDNKQQGRASWNHGKKLINIHLQLTDLFNRHQIDRVVREQGFSRFNKATQALFRVVGIADFVVEREIQQSITEYSVTTVKKAITGNGKADKQEVAIKIDQYLTEKIEFSVDDESDAVAVGICHYLKTGGVAE